MASLLKMLPNHLHWQVKVANIKIYSLIAKVCFPVISSDVLMCIKFFKYKYTRVSDIKSRFIVSLHLKPKPGVTDIQETMNSVKFNVPGNRNRRGEFPEMFSFVSFVFVEVDFVEILKSLLFSWRSSLSAMYTTYYLSYIQHCIHEGLCQFVQTHWILELPGGRPREHFRFHIN